MAQSDGSDLLPEKRHRLLALQPELRREYAHVLPDGVLLFRCIACETVYPLSHFARNDQRRYGIKASCRACIRRLRPREQHEPDPEVTRKWCIACGAHHPIAAFYVDRSQPDGYSRSCRALANRRRHALAEARHHTQVQLRRREQTLRLCGELGIDYPGHDIKRCTRCQEVKPLQEFVGEWNRVDRKRSVCRDCHTG